MGLNLEKIEQNPGGGKNKSKKWNKRQSVKRMRLVPKDEKPDKRKHKGWEY